MEELLAPVGI